MYVCMLQGDNVDATKAKRISSTDTTPSPTTTNYVLHSSTATHRKSITHTYTHHYLVSCRSQDGSIDRSIMSFSLLLCFIFVSVSLLLFQVNRTRVCLLSLSLSNFPKCFLSKLWFLRIIIRYAHFNSLETKNVACLYFILKKIKEKILVSDFSYHKLSTCETEKRRQNKIEQSFVTFWILLHIL